MQNSLSGAQMTRDQVPPPAQGSQAQYRSSRLLRDSGFRHAFFTRHGGVSTGPYRSLNFSYAATDTPENVRENLQRAAHALQVDAARLYFLSQVHGRDVRVLGGDEDRERVLFEEADALVSLARDVACGVRTADCVPILIGDRASGGVAAIHAGWRGTVAGVVAQAVQRLRRVSGGEGDLVAAIGPHISLQAFEVSEDVAQELAECSPLADVVDRSFGPKPHVDLRRIVRAQLLELGLAEDTIDDVPGCNLLDEADFFSYRRDGKASGRHLSAIVAGKA